ncbi:T9SS type A sorting domain-containing protein [Labilibacter sediminis]|nr:T9SS type A sorting domain-containing protein [Labilibacter sediminis]
MYMKKFLLLNFMGLICLGISAQPFTQNIVVSNIASPDNIIRVDLNQDGHLDILSFEGDNDIEYFKNLGDGTYSQTNIYSFLDSPREFEVADMDNDNDLDIVACSIGDDQTVLLTNDGNENFTQSFITNGNAELTNPGFFVIGNFDDDNLKDIVISGSSVAGDMVGLYYIKNQGSGSFASPSEIVGEDEMIWQVVSGDFDKDNDLDIIATRNSPYGDGGLYKAVNNGSGSFTYTAIDESFECDELKEADIDGDNDLDFVIRKSDNTVYWYENNGNFSFTAHQIPHTFTDLIRFQPVNADGDADMDLFFYTYINASITESRFKVGYFENDGNEAFTETVLLDGHHEIESAVALDLSEDGDLDFILGSKQDNNIVFYTNTAIDTPTSIVGAKHNTVQVFPNPVNDRINVVAEEPITELTIFDVTGAIIKKHTVVGETAALNVQDLKQGVYILTIVTENQTISQRFVKK